VANKILADLMKLQTGRLSKVGIVRHQCPPAIHGPRFRPTSLVVLILLVATVSLAAGLRKNERGTRRQGCAGGHLCCQ
jgi:hypothetical protein